MKTEIFVKLLKYLLISAVFLTMAWPVIAPAQTSPDLIPDRLRCEYRENPTGIDDSQPRLSWIVKSERRGSRQTAYRILVASTRENLQRDIGDFWDTGQVESDETIQIPYQGAALKSGQECFWKVMVWDGEGRGSNWSDTAMWSMGLLSEEDWHAQWIGYDTPGYEIHEMDIELPNYVPFHPEIKIPGFYGLEKSLKGAFMKVYLPSPYLRKQFRTKAAVKRATVYVTALGLYELYINGKRVGDDYFTPGWSDYRKRVYYQTYDVTGLIRSGEENVIGAILADGWYAGNVGWLGQRRYGSKLRLAGQLHLDYEDGTSELIVTDESWKASRGPIREADIQAGELYDARREMAGWSEPGFDEHGWHEVSVTLIVDSLVQAYPGIPVRRTMEIKPVKIMQPKPGTFVFNMGQNFAGWARLKVKGHAGDKVVLRFAEMLNPDGTIYTTNLRSARATDTYILKGGAEEVWEPRFTYHGFQHVEVTGYPGEPTAEAITGIVAHSGLPITGFIETSNALVNKLYSNITWGQRSNYFEVPTDCPQRDERLGWTGDAQVFIRTASYNMDVAPFFTKWMVDLTDGQFDDGSFPDVAPNLVNRVAAGWGDAGVVCPMTIHLVYGDNRILERHYAAMTRFIEFMEQRSKNFISPPLGGEGDWLNIKAPTPKDLIATAYFGYSTSLMAAAAEALGRNEDARRYHELFQNIGKAFTDYFVDQEGKVKGDTQTAYLMALKFKLIPEQLRPLAAGNLIEKIEERDWLLSTGFLGLKLLLPTLTDLGRDDVAYRLLTNRRYPSWGYSIDQGATTVWERWNSFTTDKGFASPTMNSFNHYAYGSVGEWMYNTLAGIDTDGPGFKKIIIRPRPGGGLTFSKASYDSIRGPIATHWMLEGNDLKIELTIPANTTATVFIPAVKQSDVLESNLPAAESPGIRFLRMEPAAAVFEVGSGNYCFISKNAKPLVGAANPEL